MKIGILTTAILLVATNASSQHVQGTSSTTETGQSQFAAIAEIVAQLRANTDSNWAEINIDALRAHLVDMDNLTTKSTVETNTDGLAVTFAVTGGPAVAQSVQRMMKAHSPMLQGATGWSVKTKDINSGAMMVVEATTNDEFDEIIGLGFYGLMTIGAHHQQHHVMIAMGRSPH